MDSFCQLLSNFALEYRTTHGKVVARMERKKQEKDRNKTKGKFIVSPAVVEWLHAWSLHHSLSPQTKLKDMTGVGGKEKKTKKETEDTDTSESDLVAQLANAVVKDEKRRVKDGVKARRKGRTKKKISE